MLSFSVLYQFVKNVLNCNVKFVNFLLLLPQPPFLAPLEALHSAPSIPQHLLPSSASVLSTPLLSVFAILSPSLPTIALFSTPLVSLPLLCNLQHQFAILTTPLLSLALFAILSTFFAILCGTPLPSLALLWHPQQSFGILITPSPSSVLLLAS